MGKFINPDIVIEHIHARTQDEVAIRLGLTATDVMVSWQKVGSNRDAFEAVEGFWEAWKDAPMRTMNRISAARGLGMPQDLPAPVATRVVAILADIEWKRILIDFHARLDDAVAIRGAHAALIEPTEDE